MGSPSLAAVVGISSGPQSARKDIRENFSALSSTEEWAISLSLKVNMSASAEWMTLLRSRLAGMALEAIEPPPWEPLLEAARVRSWNWRDAFATVPTPLASGRSAAELLALVLAGWLRELGAEGLARPTATPDSMDAPGIFWAFRGDRWVVLDITLPFSPESEPDPDAFLAAIERQEKRRRALGDRATATAAVVLIPGDRPTRTAQALASREGVLLWGEEETADLPSRLARLWDLPPGPRLDNWERTLRAHLAHTGDVRLFAPPSPVIPRGGSTDPVLADVDAWLESVQRARRQNWLLWTQGGVLQARFPTEGRSEASRDWSMMLAAVAGIDPSQAAVRSDRRSVSITLPDGKEARQRLVSWLKPFVNLPLSFTSARNRLQAEARVHAEAQRMAAAAALETQRPAPSSKANATPPRRNEPALRKASLADLDAALDAALGGTGSGTGR